MPRGRAASFDQQRETILQRAAELFAARGYSGTSMHELATAAGMSKALLYHYYTEKYQLLVAIGEGHIDRLLALVAKVAAEKRTREQLPRLIRGIVEEYADARYQHQVLVQDIKYLSPKDRKRIRAKERQVVDAFAAAIATTHPQLATRQLTKPLTMLLFGMINWLFTWFQHDGRISYREMAELVTAFVLGGLRQTAKTYARGQGERAKPNFDTSI
ncbi:MAG: TetR/AcrR family transcriptional regulator [Gammaproteobacteria bacterium]|nr:TetR/AcrR family transcriptional regulator [Gammaproteobacteria bacterium]